MTERMIENRVKKLQELEGQIAELQEQADTIKTELKADMEGKGLEEIQTKHFIIRWKEIVSSRLDGKALKAALPEIYNQYCKDSKSRRFTVA
ncbi:MAG: hypothetical protein LUE16_04680 [Lachnospiraceae bacterium]|nr:hypothetical protein [Lachnospiraceae bacterium]